MSSKVLSRIAALAAAALLAPATQASAALPQMSGEPVEYGHPPNPWLYGARGDDATGNAMAALGDVNGDGKSDFAVGASIADPSGRLNAGSVYVVFGRDAAWNDRIDLATFGGSAGFRIDGMASDDRFGTSVAAAGDVNGDGLDDIVIGAPRNDPSFRSNAGTAYVIFGSRSPRNIDTLVLGSAGFRIHGGAAGDSLGTSVAGNGDVDGDGRDDIVAVASSADPTYARRNAGSAYVLKGRAAGSITDLASVAADLRLDAPLLNDGMASATIAPDATGDGKADLLIGVPAADPLGRSAAGSAWFVPGRAGATPVDLGASATDKRIDGAVAGDLLGAGVATLPDVTGDSRRELVVGATGTDPGGRTNAGSFYFVDPSSLGATSDLAGGGAAVRIDGAAANDAVGTAIDAGGDLDGDGASDLAIGSPRHDTSLTDAGAVFLVESGDIAGELTLGAAPTRLAVRGTTATTLVGASVAWPGDMNGDRNSDLVVGAPYSDLRTNGGAAVVVLGWGHTSSFAYPAAAETAALTALVPLRPSVTARTGTPTFSISPAPPAGVRFDPATGTLSGTPTELTDQLNFTVSMTDAARTVTAPVTLHVSPAPGTCTNLRRGATERADLLTGSTGGDEIRGGGGDDRIDGIAGSDCLFGDAGGDTLSGGFGDDYLEGAAAADTLDGGDGSDILTGGDDTDTLDGGGGDDKMDGGAATDLLRGGDGGDTLNGATGADTLEGGTGDDTLTGADDADGLSGGDGNDALDGGAARDSLRGEGGNDRLDGGAESDTLDGGDGADELRGGDQVDEISAGPGDDSAWGDGDEDHMSGGEGNDTLFGGDGFDRIVGGAGADTLSGEDHGDTLEGGEGGDTLDGGLQHDFLIAGGGDDVAFGGAGDDLITGAAGNDSLDGGGEDDFIDAGAGDDQLRGGVRADELRAGAGNDSAWGEDGEDLVDGEGGNDRLWGGPGFDRLTGDAGNDIVLGEAGGDILEGGDGADVVDGGEGNDTVLGGNGADVVTGGAGNDKITEKGGADKIDAGAGNDTIDAADGERDVVVCGAGRDTVKADKGDKLSGCEKKTITGDPASKKKKKRKKQKSRRARR